MAPSALTQAKEALASATTDTRRPKAPADLLSSPKDDLSRRSFYSYAFFEKQKALKANPDPCVIPMANFVPNLAPPVDRNDPCPCGSGKKFKKCCRK